MKHYWYIRFIFLTTILSLTGFYTTTINGSERNRKDWNPLPPPYLGAWHFDEGTGNIAAPFYGTTDVSLINAPSWVTGRSGQAVQYNGINQYGTTSAALQGKSQITISCWIKTSVGQRKYFLSVPKSSSGFNGFDLACINGNIQCCNGYGGPGFCFLAAANYYDNQWHHVAATYDGATTRLYFDGVMIGSQSNSGSIMTDNNQVQIGRFGSYGSYFNGAIDEVLVDDKALSPSEIVDLFNGIEYVDADMDGHFAHEDCNDEDPDIFPGAVEKCNSIDDNCDGLVDEGFDIDQDGFSECNGDCNDWDPDINPQEQDDDCNGVDNNCNGLIDEGQTHHTYFVDTDSDGYGAGPGQTKCGDPGTGWSLLDGDCDDTNNSINPGAKDDHCDGVDNNCNSLIDEGQTHHTYFVDTDLDGYGAGPGQTKCGDPGAGWSLLDGDCDDTNNSINPGAEDDHCDGVDNNCNGVSDEGYLGSSCLICHQGMEVNPCFTDGDCDGISDEMDNCAGGNDSIDRNQDGKPDCQFFPGMINLEPAWKCGNKNEKILICHSPPGNPENRITICVSENALAAHLAHGDYIGTCDNTYCNGNEIRVLNPTVQKSLNEIMAYPNPVDNKLTIQSTTELSVNTSIKLINILGVPIFERTVENIRHLEIELNNIPGGIYFLSIKEKEKPIKIKQLLIR